MLRTCLSSRNILSVMLISIVSMLTTQNVIAHGTITSPKSRVYNCYLEGPESPQSAACQAAVAVSGSQGFYDWNGVRNGNAGGNHVQTCSGGSSAHAGLNLNRSDWVATNISGGSTTFTWTLTAAHATSYYRYYIGGNLFCSIGPSGAQSSASHTCNVPGSGRQTIWSVWQRSDSPEAFYACVDVIVGGGSSSGGSSSGGSSSGGSSSGGGNCGPQYSAGTSYSQGQVVSNLGNNYTCDVAGWCSSSAAWAYAPGTGSNWSSAWSSNGACGGGGSSSSGGSSSGGGSCSGLTTWNSSSVYNGGSQVQHNGVKYQAKWWTQGADPAQNSSQWAVWSNLGSC